MSSCRRNFYSQLLSNQATLLPHLFHPSQEGEEGAQTLVLGDHPYKVAEVEHPTEQELELDT